MIGCNGRAEESSEVIVKELQKRKLDKEDVFLKLKLKEEKTVDVKVSYFFLCVYESEAGFLKLRL